LRAATEAQMSGAARAQQTSTTAQK